MDSIWHKAPVVRLVIALILGATIGFYLPIDSFLLSIICGAAIILLAILLVFAIRWKYHRYELMFGVLLTFCFFFVGIALSLSQQIRNNETLILPIETESLLAELVGFPQKKENSVRLVLNLNPQEVVWRVLPVRSVKILAYAPLSLNLDTLMPGDLIHFSETPQEHKKPINPGQFDYGRYLQKSGIAGTVYIHNNIIVHRPRVRTLTFDGFFSSIQNYCIRIFENHGLDPRELGVASALILGQRSLLLPDTRDAFANAGAIHVLAVSGLHVGIIYLALVGIFGRILPARRWRFLNLTLILIVLWFYACVTGLSPSVLRAATMFTFIAIGKHGGSKANIYNMLAASAFVLVVINPAIITEVGFQLSYLAVTGIVFFFKPIYGLFIFKRWLPDKIWALLVVSFSAQLATFPISIFYFGQFPNYFLFANLLVIPGAMLSLWAGLILILVNAIPVLNILVAFVFKWILIGLITFIEWISSWPYALSENLHFSLITVILIYLLIMLIVRTYRNPTRGNVWLPLVVMLILSSLWAHRKITIANTVQISVLDGGKNSIVLVQKGKSSYVVAQDITEESQTKAQFYLAGHFIKSGVDNVEWKEITSDFENTHLAIKSGRVYYNGYSISYLNPESQKLSFNPYFTDYTIISKGIKPYQIPVENVKTMYVIDANVSDYYRLEIIAHLVKNKVPFWDMHYQGPLFASQKHSILSEGKHLD